MFYEIQKNERIAFVTAEGRRMTYSQLAIMIEEVAKNMSARSLAFCLCENSPASIISYLSCLNKKVVPLLLDKKIEREFLGRLIGEYCPEFVFTPTESVHDFPGFHLVFSYMNYSLLQANYIKKIAMNKELGLLLTTSGSTGSPKLVRQSYNNIQSNAESIAEYLKLDENEKAITTLPMNYTYGLSIINSHLLVGATILVTDEPMNMNAFWKFFNNEGATSFSGVPFTYEMLKKIKFFRMKLPTLRYMTQAGGKLSPELHKEFAEWSITNNKEFIVMYGQTEATARMGYLPPERSLDKYGSIGIAIPGGRFLLKEEDGTIISSPNTVGELIYEGDNVTLGYAESRGDLIKGDERKGILETGDLAKYDEDGYFYIVGRKKRFLKLFGNRVNLDEIDLLISKHWPNLECASTGTDDHLKLFVTDENVIGEVKQWIAGATHLSETAFEVIYVECIPRNAAGKILYSELKRAEE